MRRIFGRPFERHPVPGIAKHGEARARDQVHRPDADLEMADPVVASPDDQRRTVRTGRAFLSDPLLAVEWLARTAAEYGAPLRAGKVVLSGALGAMVVPGASSGRAVRAGYPRHPRRGWSSPACWRPGGLDSGHRARHEGYRSATGMTATPSGAEIPGLPLACLRAVHGLHDRPRGTVRLLPGASAATLGAASGGRRRESSPSDQTVPHCEQRRRGSGRDPDLCVGVLHVAVGGLGRDAQRAGDRAARSGWSQWTRSALADPERSPGC
jgi:hypothetical protein